MVWGWWGLLTLATPPAEVPCHGRFEVVLDHAAAGDLRLSLTSPAGQRHEAAGFADGGRRWVARWRPDEPGDWRWEARFSDGASATGTFRCLPSDRPAPVRVEPTNPLWLTYGERRFLRGLHVGDRFFAANWPEVERQAFLDWFQARGYNLLSIASCLLNRDEPGRGRGWQTPRLWPPDPAEWRRAEAIFDELERRQIVVYPFAGFFGKASAYPREPAEQERYLRYAIARLAAYGNLLWVVAGPEPNVNQGWMQPDEVERLGRLIAALDPQPRPLSVHNRTGDDPWRDSDWTTYGILQGPKTLQPRELAEGLRRNHHPAKPLVAQETLWAGNKYHPDYSLDDLRRNALIIAFSAATLVFGDMDGDSSSGFSGTLDPRQCQPERHAVIQTVSELIEQLPWWRLKPRPELVSRGWCLADPGRDYAIYVDRPGLVEVKLAGGPYRLVWLDPRTGARRDGGETADGRLTTPAEGDWVAWLTAGDG